MWNRSKRIFLLVLILMWQIIQFVIFTYRVFFKNDKKMFEIAYAYDVLANVSWNGDRGETISSRVGWAYMHGRRYAKIMRPIIDSLFGEGHCIDEALEYRRPLPRP